MKRKYFLMFAVAVILILWSFGFIGLWTKGITYITSNTKKFTNEKGGVLSKEYSVLIDLSDLKSNIGKELYNDGENRVYVSWLEGTSDANGGYRIGFRASGKYSLSGATLITGVQYIAKNNGFSEIMSAKMTAEHNGRTYNSIWSGMDGLNYKDGDAFYFYTFPQEFYSGKDISLLKNGTVKLTVSNLYNNVWIKK